MPITADRKHLYPANWKQISARIRFVRAEGRCECVGECGLHKGRCKRRHGHVEYREKWDGGHIETREVKIVLTVAHRIHGSDCSDANLLRSMSKLPSELRREDALQQPSDKRRA